MEFLARDPDVVQIYEVFSDVQIDKFISVAGLLRPSRVVDIEDKSGSGTVLSNERTSAMNFIDDSTPETRFIGKSALITGLKITGNASEYTQVSSYTVGGHYEAHIDSVSTGIRCHKRISNTIALQYTYISATVRLHLGLTRRPNCNVYGLCKTSPKSFK